MTEPAIPVHRWGPADARDGLHHLGPCYLGHRSRGGCFVLVMPSNRSLAPRLDVWNHSPTGFEWGYHGSGPAQLALALLLDAGLTDAAASRLHQAFKREVIARIGEMESWLIYRDDVLAWVNSQKTTR